MKVKRSLSLLSLCVALVTALVMNAPSAFAQNPYVNGASTPRAYISGADHKVAQVNNTFKLIPAKGQVITCVVWHINNNQTQVRDEAAPWQLNWNTSTLPNGVYRIWAEACDERGNSVLVRTHNNHGFLTRYVRNQDPGLAPSFVSAGYSFLSPTMVNIAWRSYAVHAYYLITSTDAQGRTFEWQVDGNMNAIALPYSLYKITIQAVSQTGLRGEPMDVIFDSPPPTS